MEIQSLKSLIEKHAEICNKIEGLIRVLNKVHPQGEKSSSPSWECDLRKDERFEVKFLYEELMNQRRERTLLELSYVVVLDNEEVKGINEGRITGVNFNKEAFKNVTVSGI